ncbi:MAG: 4-hydroxy-tetrahydrodipicolinate reductase, partial [Deltaproteobacteria bacterium]|nr:4-hydroxy-tetrahydrodipicolinate reductase [Deltaproteobacteria bacterium]
SRDNFARGAVLAAKWVAAKSPGVYTMFDVLGLE